MTTNSGSATRRQSAQIRAEAVANDTARRESIEEQRGDRPKTTTERQAEEIRVNLGFDDE